MLGTFTAFHCRLSQLSPEERQAVLTETCPDFTRVFREVLQRHQDFRGRATVSALPQSTSMSIVVCQQEAWKRERAPIMEEETLYKAVRLFSKNEYLDSITVSRKLVNDVGIVMNCFGAISEGQCFQTPNGSSAAKQAFYHKNSKGLFCDGSSSGKSKHGSQNSAVYDNFPQWFNPGLGGTVHEWLCAFFEQILLCK